MNIDTGIFFIILLYGKGFNLFGNNSYFGLNLRMRISPDHLSMFFTNIWNIFTRVVIYFPVNKVLTFIL